MKGLKLKGKRRYVVVNFLDHAMNEGVDWRAIPCTAVGMLVGEDKDCYYVASWVSEDTLDHNMESFAILKKVITSMKTLELKNGRAKTKKAK